MSQETYTCQQCRQPLILDPSVANITFDEASSLISSLPPRTTSEHLSVEKKLAGLKTSKESKEAYLRGTTAAQAERELGFAGGAGDSFILLGGETPPARSSRAIAARPEDDKREDTQSPRNPPATLLETLSSRTAVDHPLCSECARLLQETLQAKLEDLTKERDAYLGFEKDWSERLKAKIKSGGGSVPQDLDALVGGRAAGAGKRLPLDQKEFDELSKQKERLEAEKQELMGELLEAEEEERRLEEEERTLGEEKAELEQEEIDFLHAYQEAQENDKLVRQDLATEKTHLLIASQHLARLESTNVYNDVFQIGHVPLIPPSGVSAPSGSTTNAEQLKRFAANAIAATTGTGQTVGTINGLRLGGRPYVEWVEINAALGLVALCIDRMAVKVGCIFQVYKILPLGSFSRVDELPPSKNSYELYASTDISAARLLQNRRFNYALVGMLDCLRQLVEYQRERSRGWGGSGLEIQKDRIAGHSVKLNANMGMSSIGLGGTTASTEAEESWTKALRAVLAVLKRILVIESEADREATDVQA